MAETIYFERGKIRVTNTSLSTRFKDEPLLADQSVIVGRDPVWMSAIVAVGLMLYAISFGDLLYGYEQALLIGCGLLAVLVGACTATLQIGQYMRERTVLVSTIWTVNKVRRAIAKAKAENPRQVARSVIPDDAES